MPIVLFAAVSCTTVVQAPDSINPQTGRDPDRLLVVDCLLPGQLRRLGGRITFMTPRRATRVSASECEIRGGEYVAYDRANFASSLKIWLPEAESGDPKAQTLVGEIFEKGLGQVADPVVAAQWYRKAADQGYSRARINLGYLYESGLGVPQDVTRAMNLYRLAAGFDDGQLEYVTSLQLAERKQQSKRIPQLKQQIDSANLALNTERQEFSRLQAEFQTLEQKTEALRAELSQKRSAASNQDSTQQSTQVSGLLNEISALKEELKLSESETLRLQTEVKNQQRQSSELRQNVARGNSELNEAENELAEQSARIKQLELGLVERQGVVQNDNDKQLIDLQQQLQDTTSARNALLEKIEQIKSSNTARTSELIAKLRVAEARENSLVQDLGRARSSLTGVQSVIDKKEIEYRARLDELAQTQLSLQQKIQQQITTIDSLESQIAENKTQTLVETEISRLQTELTVANLSLATLKQQKSESETSSVQALAQLENQLLDRRTDVDRQTLKINELQKNVSVALASEEGPAIESISSIVASGPTIEIIDPPVKSNKNRLIVPVGRSEGVVDIIGRVSSPDGVLSFRVNDEQESLNDNGVFLHAANVTETRSLSMAAVDEKGERSALEVELSVPSTESAVALGENLMIDLSDLDFGEYHALVIGNSNYTSMSDIPTGAADATAIASMLDNRFGFDTELLIDADRYDILAALNRKRDELGRRDNLLIYFSGHGVQGNNTGYWLPIDADPNDKSTWVSNVSVTSFIDSLSAKHVMVVADSVFTGTLSRSSLVRVSPDMDADAQRQLYELVANSRVRTVLSSGAERPYSSGVGPEVHSVFTNGVLEALADSRKNLIMAHDLFLQMRKQSGDASVPAEHAKLPQYAPIKYSGHENGEFIFVPLERRVGSLSDSTKPVGPALMRYR